MPVHSCANRVMTGDGMSHNGQVEIAVSHIKNDVAVEKKCFERAGIGQNT